MDLEEKFRMKKLVLSLSKSTFQTDKIQDSTSSRPMFDPKLHFSEYLSVYAVCECTGFIIEQYGMQHKVYGIRYWMPLMPVHKVSILAHDTFHKNAKYRKRNIFLDFKIQV